MKSISIIFCLFLSFFSNTTQARELEWKDYYLACKGKSYLRLKLFPHRICTYEIKKTVDAIFAHSPNIDSYMDLYDSYHLNLNGKKLSDLRPLKGLHNLLWLSLAHNNITDIRPLGTLTQLKELKLFSNKIVDITPLSQLEHINSLYLSKNKIRDFEALRNLSTLQFVELHDNNFKHLDFLENHGNLSVIIRPQKIPEEAKNYSQDRVVFFPPLSNFP